jgi:hypothetical protein
LSLAAQRGPIATAYQKVTSRSLPAGSYAIAATANVQITVGGSSGDNSQSDTACELRNTSGAGIGGARDRRVYPHQQITTVSLSMNGGVQVPAGGGEVGLYCRIQSTFLGQVADGQMMILKLDGFF